MAHQMPQASQPPVPARASGDPVAQQRAALRRLVCIGYLAVGCFGVAVVGWTVQAEVRGAVIAPGQIVVESNAKKVQHSTGGIVAELPVRDGDNVKAGTVVARLDDTVARTNLQIVTRQIDELAIKSIRLEAERSDAGMLNWPEEMTKRLAEPEIRQILASERALFETRRAVREGQQTQSHARVAQLTSEIAGLGRQLQAREREIVIVERELQGIRRLSEKKLVPLTKLNQLERDAATLEGTQGQLTAQIGQSQARVAETRQQLLQADAEARNEILRDLRDTQARSGELLERRVAALDQLQRTALRAPVSGQVYQLAVHTHGGVVGPGETLMSIMPADDQLNIEAKVSPTDIDLVTVGQRAMIRLHSFNPRTTPELSAFVTRISSDTVRDPQNGNAFFTIRLLLPRDELARVGPQPVLPGMLGDVFIETEARSPLSYLLRPVKDQFARAMRER